PMSERVRFLDTACGTDTDLRSEIERLLAADGLAYDRIERIVVDGAARASDALNESPGTMIGTYRLIRALGRGGMGSVWLAAASDQPNAPVALKLMRPEIVSPDIIRRFRSEQQILDELRHDNIAQLVSGGTHDGRPYFVMEYIQGEPIDVWCCNRGLSVEARIDLFLAVCAAVQFAHTSGVVHRDLKPGNILVTQNGTPKLLDFGIAKLLGARRSQAVQTAPGVRMMTPHYASPEQVRGNPVSPATDVYALAVVLYELLTERLPYRLEKELPHVLASAILAQTPEPPSTVVHSTTLRDRLSRDLDIILLTALQKEPERRYASVAEFAGELRRSRTARSQPA
ncbi:MAG: serine/threonine-protein kinase, partial [Longimicrobiales bacterium]